VHGRFGKKRGVYLGEVLEIQTDRIVISLQAPLKPGDGIVFDCGHPEQKEEGGRIYQIEQLQNNKAKISFGKEAINWQRIHLGDRLWKTNDPELDKAMRQTYESEQPQIQQQISLEVHGSLGENLIVIARDKQGNIAQIESDMPLVAAHSQPLQPDNLRNKLGRLGSTPFCLGELENHLQGRVILPVSELNRIRRSLVQKLIELRSQPKSWQLNHGNSFTDLTPKSSQNLAKESQLNVLVRNLEQLQAAIDTGITACYCEFEDPRNYQSAVKIAREQNIQIFIAPPRISKPNENWILQQLKAADADGYLIRNYDHLESLIDPNQPRKYIGDFGLNLANPISADYLIANYPLVS
jgi:U32 family peptidase